MSLGRILRLGWSLFRHSWRTILGATAICMVPVYVLMTGVAASFSPLVNEWVVAAQSAQLQGLAPPPPPSGFGIAFFSLILATIVLALAALLAAAAIIRVVDNTFRAQPIGIGAALRDSLSRLASLVVANLLFLVAVILIVFLGLISGVSLMIGGGFPAFLGLVILVATVAALVFLGMRTSLVPSVAVIDRAGGADSLVRSWRLTSGSGWRVLGYLIVIGLIDGGLSLLLTGIPTALLRLSDTAALDVAIGTVLNGLAGILLAAISPIVLTLLYYDLRWRAGETVPTPGGGEASASHGAVPSVAPPWGPPPL